jgi:nicotinamidase-related amidase
MARVWDKFLTAQDRAVFEASGYGVNIGFGERPALLIVDMSYGFTGDKPEPLLQSIRTWHNSCGEAAWCTIPVIRRLTDAFRDRRLPVIYTTGSFREDNWDSGSALWKNALTSAMARTRPNLDPNRIVEEIAPQPQDIVVLKQKPSGFLGTNLLNYLVLLRCDSIILAGTTTSGCVRATAVDAYSYNFRVTVAEDACSDRFEFSHAASLYDMHVKYADVITSAAVIDHVHKLSSDLFPNLPTGKIDACE